MLSRSETDRLMDFLGKVWILVAVIWMIIPAICKIIAYEIAYKANQRLY